MRTTIYSILTIFALLFLIGCKSSPYPVYVPVESTKVEYRDKLIRDSVFEKEFIRIYQKGDTIYKDSIVYRYRDKIIKDTVNITDTVGVPYPVKGDTEYTNILKWWQEASVWFTSLVLVALALYLGIKYRGKIFSFFRKMVFKI